MSISFLVRFKLAVVALTVALIAAAPFLVAASAVVTTVLNTLVY